MTHRLGQQVARASDQWSRAAIALAAVAAIGLAAASARAQNPGVTRETFEVESVKPMGAVSAEMLVAFGSGCDGSFPRLENRRFTVTTTPYALITWAYGFNRNGGCAFVNRGDFITGGPAWVRNERFEIQALMPEGAAAYSAAQFLNGNAPELEAMLRTMLAERFKLAIHRETKEASVYELVVAKGGPKIAAAKETDRPSLGIRMQRSPTGQVSQHIVGGKTTITYLAVLLVMSVNRPVIDRTGLTGEFTFDLEFAPPDAAVGDTSASSIFTAIQEQLGLRLEAARAPVEVLVIDRAERPSEN